MKPTFRTISSRDALHEMRQQQPGYRWLSAKSQIGLKIDIFEGVNMRIPGKRKHDSIISVLGC